jgi:hypothetical protein
MLIDGCPCTIDRLITKPACLRITSRLFRADFGEQSLLVSLDNGDKSKEQSSQIVFFCSVHLLTVRRKTSPPSFTLGAC